MFSGLLSVLYVLKGPVSLHRDLTAELCVGHKRALRVGCGGFVGELIDLPLCPLWVWRVT